MLLLVEGWKPQHQKQTQAEATKEKQEEALRFLHNPANFDEILADLETIGITGEETNKLTGYHPPHLRYPYAEKWSTDQAPAGDARP